MAAAKFPSPALTCDFAGCQTGDKRFSTRAREHRPRLRDFRCNLTALSQVHNLYFVAVVDELYVYQPNFPDQFLQDEPALIIKPPKSGNHLRSQIDHECKHSATRLHVDFLGNEELLLIACDDGDVIGYKTCSIQYELEKRLLQPAIGEEESLDNFPKLRPFFHRNFLLSAWGLAIHREARLLAVSSNTHCIAVIAFALTLAKEPEEDSACPAPGPTDNKTDFPYPRKREHILSLIAGHNIPSVSFDNHGTDPEGRWLLSNVIDGNVFLWDLHHPASPARRIRLGFCAGALNPKMAPRHCICLERGSCPHAAWAAIFIDPRSCRKYASVEDAVGSRKAEKDDEFFWNMSPSAESLTDREAQQSENNPTTNMETQSGPHGFAYEGVIPTPIPQNIVVDLTQDEGDEDADMSEVVESDEMSDTEDEYYQQLTSQIHMASASDATSFEAPVLLPGHNGPTAAIMSLSNFTQTSNFSYLGGNDAFHSGEAETMPTGAMGQIQPGPLQVPNLMRRDKKRPFFEPNKTNTLAQHTPPPSTPIMIVSRQDVFLLQPLNSENNFEGDPIIAMNDPLLSAKGRPAPVHDRLCFTVEIPELGVVLVGSPVGRVSMLTLTQTRIRKSRHGKTLYGFRYNPAHDLLPLAAQRRAYPTLEDPHNRLIGIAVSPMQGMQAASEMDTPRTHVPGSKRWRVMLHYIDNTVLNYELSWGETGAAMSTIVI